MTKRVVLIGHPVAHSLSGAMQHAAFHHPGLDASYEATLDLSANASVILAMAEDRKEARSAFLEKREPKFKGR